MVLQSEWQCCICWRVSVLRIDYNFCCFMKYLIIPYSIFIIIFGLFTTLLMLASSHHVDKDFLIINLSSLVVFPLTAYFLSTNTGSQPKTNKLTLFLLSLTAIIFIYYTYDLFKNESEISWFSYLPLAALILTLAFMFMTVQKR